MTRKTVFLWIGILVLVMALGLPVAYASGAANASSRAAAGDTDAVASTTKVSLASASSTANAAAAGLDLEVLYEDVNPSVVEVVNLASAGRFTSTPIEQGLGSGFVWDEDGHIVTNDHVVEGADVLHVIFADGTRLEAKLVGTDPSSDLAVLSVDPDAVELKPIALGDMSGVRVGESVVAIGNPYGHLGTMTEGIVSGLGRTISSQTSFSIANAIQTDAAVNPGNSGGPLLNEWGQVIGVNDQIESGSGSSSGVGFAIPISIVRRVVPALIESGQYEHSYLGLSGGAYNMLWAEELGLPDTARGVYVLGVTQNGPAAKAGLRGGSDDTSILLEITQRGPQYLQAGGDLITAIDGRPVSGMDDLMTYLSESTTPGQKVELTVLRSGGKEKSITVTLGVQPAVVSQTAW